MFDVLKRSTCANNWSKIIKLNTSFSRKRPVRCLFFMLGVAIFFSIFSTNLFAQNLTSKQKKMLKGFEDAAQEINRSLPARSDNTTISRVEVGPGLRFTTFAIVHGLGTTGSSSASSFARTTEQVTVELACKDRDILKAVRQGMVFQYVYKLVDGSNLTDFIVDRARCR